jgi:hypothetical protein
MEGNQVVRLQGFSPDYALDDSEEPPITLG